MGRAAHFILQSDTLPEESKACILTMLKNNKDYSFSLWVDGASLQTQQFCRENSIRLRDLPKIVAKITWLAQFYNQWLIIKQYNPMLAVELLRLAVLYAFGGLCPIIDAMDNASFSQLEHFTEHDPVLLKQLKATLIKPIPKDVHFIWLGSRLPEKYEKNILTWLERNPDYKFHLWIDSAALDLQTVETDLEFMGKFCKEHRVILHDVAVIEEFKDYVIKPWYNDWLNGRDKTLVFAADNLRLEILYRYGGIYSDIDMVCLAPLGVLANKYGFLAWGGFNERRNGFFITDNCFIASVANHAILQQCIEKAQQQYIDLLILQKTGSNKTRSNPYDLDPAYNTYRFASHGNLPMRGHAFSAPASTCLMNDELRGAGLETTDPVAVFIADHKLQHQLDGSWKLRGAAPRAKGVLNEHGQAIKIRRPTCEM